jgi:cellulose synthase/poly-beta-1,6-N-acetylglucosamine synthase-like glycosyltransferase
VDILFSIFAIISFLLLGYTYIFFPFIVNILAKNKEFQFTSLYFPKVAIIMSAYQEEAVIKNKILSIKNLNYPLELLTVWIASDGSTDDTNTIIWKECKDLPNFKYFFFGERRGKPSVINDLVVKAQQYYEENDFVLILTDANVILDSELVHHLVKPLIEAEIALVDTKIYPLERFQKGISISENYYLNREALLKENEGKWDGLAMGASGGCYAIRSKYYVPVPENFLVDDFFISFNVLLKGKKTILYSEAICYEEVSSSILTEFKRRRRISAGNFQNLSFFISYFSLNQFKLWFVFFSHKILRWFGPMLIANLFISMVVLSLYHLVVLKYLSIFGFILLVFIVLDKLLENNHIHLSHLRGIRYFIVINAAILMGFFDFLKGIKNNVWEPTKRNQ